MKSLLAIAITMTIMASPLWVTFILSALQGDRFEVDHFLLGMSAVIFGPVLLIGILITKFSRRNR
jgi:hypothetical protein